MTENNVSQSGLKRRVQEAITSWKDEMVDFARELVSIRTENPPGVFYCECAEAIVRKLGEVGLDCEVVEVPRSAGGRGIQGASSKRSDAAGADSQAAAKDGGGPAGYCVSSCYGSGSKSLYFHGHYDVVPASNESQFAASVKGGCLIGRGSSDMKGGLAAMIYAVRALKVCEVPLGGRVCLVFVPDEETGGTLGSRYLAQIGILGKDGIGMLTAEPTSGAIWNASRGAISLRVTVKGKPAHVGLHYQGVNAFEGMLVVAGALLELKSEVELRKTAYKISPDKARGSILLIGGRCEAGTNFNAVPEKCWFTVDRRINPEEDLDEERDRLLEVIQRLRDTGINIDVEVLQEGASSGTREDAALAVALSEALREVRGGSASFEMCPGLLETRFYASLGVPALAYGPGQLSVSHGPEEFVKIEDVCDCAAVYALTAAKILKL
jgi:succinyl-diaminopimelate desuccinylase